MANQPWLDEVERRLFENRLPPGYIRRFVDELADHFEDITEEIMSKEASVLSRLGEADQVADAAVVAYRQRTFFGRHRSATFWVFGVSPIAAMLAVFVFACLGIAAIGALCEKCGVRLADGSHLGGVDPATLGWGVSLITTIVPAALLTILYCGFARRFDISKKWMLASCGALAFIAMLPFQSITLSDMPGKSMWTIGLGLPSSLLQCVQLIVPLAVGLGWMGKQKTLGSLFTASEDA
jgi:uncharacterized membrane protein YhaH (DUF805 family)